MPGCPAGSVKANTFSFCTYRGRNEAYNKQFIQCITIYNLTTNSAAYTPTQDTSIHVTYTHKLHTQSDKSLLFGLSLNRNYTLHHHERELTLASTYKCNLAQTYTPCAFLAAQHSLWLALCWWWCCCSRRTVTSLGPTHQTSCHVNTHHTQHQTSRHVINHSARQQY